MKATTNPRNRQVYSVGNYLMTGKVLGKGHFARVEEATHRIIGKKVAVKIIDLTLIKEEYARRNLHREPRVMARLRHPCIAALYETMMHGPRLYVVMEAAGGGDLCAHVLAARGSTRGLPETRARALATQLVSAVRHMHARGVVHRDLKMENIMLDSTKQFIKIVDFGLSNVWSAGATLRTPCGSLEYAAPELFVDGRRYGPEVDLWSIGVIVYGMVTGGLPFTGSERAGRSRPQLRAAIARGFSRKQRAALAGVTVECKSFVQALLEPNVEQRMKIEDAARHRWIKRPGMRMRVHPLANVDAKVNREMFKHISELCGKPVVDVAAQLRAEPFGAVGGIYNIKTHLHQISAVPGAELLWTSNVEEVRPASPPEYKALQFQSESTDTNTADTGTQSQPQRKMIFTSTTRNYSSVIKQNGTGPTTVVTNGTTSAGQTYLMARAQTRPTVSAASQVTRDLLVPAVKTTQTKPSAPFDITFRTTDNQKAKNTTQPFQCPRISMLSRPLTGGVFGQRKPVFKYDSGDCGLDPRLPCIDEHSKCDLNGKTKPRTPFLRKLNVADDRRLSSCPNRMGDGKRDQSYNRNGGNALLNWRAGNGSNDTRVLLQDKATSIKRASLGNIVSPHSSSNSHGHCKSERAVPQVSWISRTSGSKDPSPLQRLRRTTPMK